MAQQQTLKLQILAPQANALAVIGQMLNVAGDVSGKGGPEPVVLESVVVQVGGNPPVTATVKRLLHTTVPSYTFSASVQVPGPPGPMAVQVTADFDNNQTVHQAQTVDAVTGALTGVWSGDDGTQYFVKEDASNVWWVGMDTTPGVHGPGLNVTSVFRGGYHLTTLPSLAESMLAPVIGLGISGEWADVPRGTRMGSGTLIFQPVLQLHKQVHQLQVVASTGGFTTRTLTRVQATPELIADIQTVLGQVQKNVNGESLGDNLNAYKDHVVLFGTLIPQNGQSVTVNWAVNADRSYQGFICADADGNHDGDANIDMAVDRDKLDSGGDFDQPGFWTQGWEPGMDPADIKSYLDDNDNRLHLEMVMFGRGAKCSQPDHFGDPPLVPSWQQMGGDSVLVNGRPLNGLGLDPIAGLGDVPSRVVVLNDKALVGFTLRVTGPLVADVGHLFGDDHPEIHPVYAIDVMDATPQDNLSGVWGDNVGNTYYVRHVVDTVWWFGMGPVRDTSFGQVFQGTMTNGVIAGLWQDVPFGTGDTSGSLRLTLDPSKLGLVPDPQGPFASRRWLKLYDS